MTVRASAYITLARVDDAEGVEVGGRNYVRTRGLAGATANGVTADVDGDDIRVHGTNGNKEAAYELLALVREDGLFSPGDDWTVSTTETLPAGVCLQVNTGSETGPAVMSVGKGESRSDTGTVPGDGDGSCHAYIGVLPDAGEVDVTFRVKLERGNRATDWTPAPEDVWQGVEDAQDSADGANGKIDQEIPNIEYSMAQIEVLNDSIRSMVTDENGESLMEQTADGWTFNISSIQKGIDDALGGVAEANGSIEEVRQLADKTSELANDISEKTAYINMAQDETGAPVMELGQRDGQFKLRITNTSMDFMQGSQRIAYLSNRQLHIQSSVVTDEMKVGAASGYVWKRRANGNMGLRYVAG